MGQIRILKSMATRTQERSNWKFVCWWPMFPIELNKAKDGALQIWLIEDWRISRGVHCEFGTLQAWLDRGFNVMLQWLICLRIRSGTSLGATKIQWTRSLKNWNASSRRHDSAGFASPAATTQSMQGTETKSILTVRVSHRQCWLNAFCMLPDVLWNILAVKTVGMQPFWSYGCPNMGLFEG